MEFLPYNKVVEMSSRKKAIDSQALQLKFLQAPLVFYKTKYWEVITSFFCNLPDVYVLLDPFFGLYFSLVESAPYF